MDSYFYPQSLTSDCPDKHDPFEKKGGVGGGVQGAMGDREVFKESAHFSIIILENLYIIMPVLDFYYRFMCTIRVI